ncbi:unnamed protein product [marine sediment metagenome]|uniref:Uncharacterized protein n=1 Tax=marine sediment metagenome TaxID=412755 RepID=X0Z1T3_9ZZZZ
MKQIVQTWTGWDGQNWDWRKAKALVAAGAGCAVSYVAAKTGINRYTPTRINL